MYLSNTNDEKVEKSTLEKIQLKYDDERVMNGGEVFDGIFGRFGQSDGGPASALN